MINKNNLLIPKLYGIGYIGIGDYKSKDDKGIGTLQYEKWKAMLRRCHGKKELKRQPTYIGCSVAKEWHNFQNFAQWYEQNYKENFHLDKDILIKGNKIYSPETCCFVPQEINILFTNRKNHRGTYPIGVIKMDSLFMARINKRGKSICLGRFSTPEEAFNAYKTAKEANIKDIANEWRGKITEKVYNSMYNWIIEITD